MKKYISLAFMAIALTFGFAGCSVETDEEPGGTAVQKMAGRWTVSVYELDDNGNEIFEVTSMNKLMTYNTADNSANQMWITDNKGFWAFTMKVDIDYAARTFSCTEVDYDAVATGKATITNGKILEGAGKNIHGMPTDSIVFDIKFSDDTPAYGTTYRFTGTRYSGFTE